jgi:predicted transcriptional regulator
MSNVTFSMRIDSKIKKKLDIEAKNKNRSSSYIATQAIEHFLKAIDTKREAIEEALEIADKGEFVSSKAVNDWVDSWENEKELSAPEIDTYSDTK